MPIPYHGNTDYTITRLDTGIIDTDGLGALQNIISGLDPSGVDIDISKLVGNMTLQDGGVLGKLLRLLRVHMNDMQDRNELTESITGEIYSNLIGQAMAGSMDFLFKNIEIKQADRERSLAMIEQLYKIEASKLSVDKMQIDREAGIFDLRFLKPLEHESLVEQIEKQHIEHQMDSFNLSTIMPKQATLLDDDHCLKSTECAIKTYYKDEIQPEEKLTAIANRQIAQATVELKAKELVLAQTTNEIKAKELLIAQEELEVRMYEADIKKYEIDHMMPIQLQLLQNQACVQAAECAIKTYYNVNIQPFEKDVTKAKAFQEEVLTGDFTAADSLNQKKIDQLAKQTELYERQKLFYDDQKYQKLLETQVNYAAMVFADVEDVPDVLDMSLDSEVNIVYGKLKENI